MTRTVLVGALVVLLLLTASVLTPPAAVQSQVPCGAPLPPCPGATPRPPGNNTTADNRGFPSWYITLAWVLAGGLSLYAFLKTVDLWYPLVGWVYRKLGRKPRPPSPPKPKKSRR